PGEAFPRSPFREAHRDSTMERRNSTPVITSASLATGGASFGCAFELLYMGTFICRSFHFVNFKPDNGLLVDDSNCATPAQLLDAGDKIAVWFDIIAFRFHHHHEITLAFHVKQYLGFSLAFGKKRMKSVYRSFV